MRSSKILSDFGQEIDVVWLEKQRTLPTKEDHEKMISIRERLKFLAEVRNLGPSDAQTQSFFYNVAVNAVKKQEEFFRSNGNAWAE